MGRREADSSGAMTTSHRSELCCLQDAASSGHHHGEESPRLAIRSPCEGDKQQRTAFTEGAPRAAVRKHQHKHNLKHRYEVMETLGKGTYGKVKKAVERASLKTVAIKSIRKERIVEDLDRIHIQREIEITASLRHANIIRFHEVFESRDKIVIVMEYASRGELYDYVLERRRLSETEARGLFRQITSAVHYCHKFHHARHDLSSLEDLWTRKVLSCLEVSLESLVNPANIPFLQHGMIVIGVVHRDLKLENILLDEDMNVKLADFGLSNHFKRDSLLQTYCGSPLYAAPEIVKGLPYQGPEVDCWALGVLLYALVYCSMPFDGASHTTLTEQITKGRYRRPNPPSDACALIDWLLTVRVDERATIEDVANHWWVNWGFEESVCDCPSLPHPECPSPLLARYIDWQYRITATNDMTVDSFVPSDTSCSPTLSANPCYFTLPLKSEHGGGGRMHRGTLSLRKSRKENAIPQTALGACGSAFASPPSSAASSVHSTSDRKKPKGILKPQRSFDSVFQNPPKEKTPSQPCQAHAHVYSDVLSTSLPSPSTFSQPSSKMPKKGILKNLYERESGYGSSTERRNSGARIRESDAVDMCSHKQHSYLPASEESPTLRTEAVRRRKGILKRNGKFSRSLDLPNESHSSPCSSAPVFPDDLQQLLQGTGAKEAQRSRPSSVISEDSLFSCDSFDLLDLNTQTRRRMFMHRRQHSTCSSEEDLEPLRSGEEDQVGRDGRKDAPKTDGHTTVW